MLFSRVHTILYVTMSVRRSVGLSVGLSVITSLFWAFRAKRRADFSYCPCPATILPLPTCTRLMLPCIRPCFSAQHILCFSVSILLLYRPIATVVTFLADSSLSYLTKYFSAQQNSTDVPLFLALIQSNMLFEASHFFSHDRRSQIYLVAKFGVFQ